MSRDRRDDRPETGVKSEQTPVHHTKISGSSGSHHSGHVKLNLLAELCIILMVLCWFLFSGKPNVRQALVTHWCTESFEGTTLNHCGEMDREYRWNE